MKRSRVRLWCTAELQRPGSKACHRPLHKSTQGQWTGYSLTAECRGPAGRHFLLLAAADGAVPCCSWEAQPPQESIQQAGREQR